MIYLTTRDVADLIGVKTTTAVVTRIDNGMLPCARVRIGKFGRKHHRPTVQEVEAYLQEYDRALLPALRAKWPDAFHVQHVSERAHPAH